MGEKLNPQLRSNRRAIESLERDWQTYQLWQKLSPWKTWPLLLFSAPLAVLVAIGLVVVLGLDDRWAGPVGILLIGGAFHLFRRFLYKGWFRWLMR